MPVNILAIETSCDETSASVLTGSTVLSNIISSQHFHTDYGGIVPELASREHIKCIDRIAEDAIKLSGLLRNELNLVCATQGPGLIGSLLTGFNFGKAFAIGQGIHFLGINHIEAHLYSCFIGQDEIEFPFIGLIVSGGHTILYLAEDYFTYKLLGETQDDAGGESFDKAAKMLGLGYPGGPEIDKLSLKGNEKFHNFPISNFKENIYDFSFSGIKTSLLYFLRKNYPDMKNIPVPDICASYQKAVTDALIEKTLLAAKNYNIRKIAVSGGVSANSRLRKEFLIETDFDVSFPKKEYSTDNAAMIGYLAYLKHTYGKINYSGFFSETSYSRLSKL